MNSHDLTTDSIKKLFLRYLIPSISATLVTSIYILVDTIIIGKGIGQDAVAALNIVLPLFTFFFGLGLLFGVGGAVLFSVSKGEGNITKGNQFFSTSVVLVIITSLTCISLCILRYEDLIHFLGSDKDTLPYINQYAPYIIYGAPVFVCSAFLQTFVRNDGDPTRSMVAVITGGVLNIIFDITLVFGFDMGMSGAAIASVLGISVTCLILFSHFFSKGNHLKFMIGRPKFSFISKIILTGFSSFLIEIAGGIVILSFNIQLLKYSSVSSITAYSIISNTALIVTSLSDGVSQAAQPLLATNYGANKPERVKDTFKLGFLAASFVGIVFFAISFFVPKLFIYTYISPSTEVLSIAMKALRIYSAGFLFAAMNTFICNYFQATLKGQISLLLCVLRTLLLTLFLVYTLPILFGADGIWAAVPIAEVLTFILAFVLVYKRK